MKINDAYVAGFFDGEGCIYFRKQRPNQITVTITQKDKYALERIQHYLGYGAIYTHHSKRNKTTVYTLRINRRALIEDFLTRMKPYLWVKRKKMTQALEVIWRRASV